MRRFRRFRHYFRYDIRRRFRSFEGIAVFLPLFLPLSGCH